MERKEKENATAVLRREEGGQDFVRFPVAPFNSTQFLMDEHKMCPAGSNSPSVATRTSVNSTPMDCSPKPDGVINLEKKDKEFVDIYTSVHAESLQSLPKEELVKHYMSLEEKIASLEKQIMVKQKPDNDSDGKTNTKNVKDATIDSVSGCDTNSLSSSNEEFVDLSTINRPTISVGDCDHRPSIDSKEN
jgi:hypothetical protein